VERSGSASVRAQLGRFARQEFVCKAIEPAPAARGDGRGRHLAAIEASDERSRASKLHADPTESMNRSARVTLTPRSRAFSERFRPAPRRDPGASELRRLIEHGEIADEPPEWMASRMQEADAYLIVGNDLVLPLAAAGPSERLIAKTCIPRGGISGARHPQRAQARAQRVAGDETRGRPGLARRRSDDRRAPRLDSGDVGWDAIELLRTGVLSSSPGSRLSDDQRFAAGCRRRRLHRSSAGGLRQGLLATRRDQHHLRTSRARDDGRRSVVTRRSVAIACASRVRSDSRASPSSADPSPCSGAS
jgi:hypothetical protein